MDSPRNVLLITVDCLRPDHLPMYGYDRDTTPFLKRFTDSAHLFNNAFATGPGTSVSFPSILAGTYPFDYGGYKGLSTDRTPLAELLSDAGVSTAGLHSNTFLSQHKGYNRGFDKYESFINEEASPPPFARSLKQTLPEPAFNWIQSLSWRFESILGTELSVPYRPAEETNEIAENWVDELEEPFFLWVHYLDPHEPHCPPERHHSKFSNESVDWGELQRKWKRTRAGDVELSDDEIQTFIDAYDAEIRFVDECIEDLYSTLECRGIDDDTLTVITADHGEEFLDHGSVGHAPSVYDELIHVPLIVDFPDRGSGRVDDLVSLIDLPPTILSAMDVEHPKTYRGSSIQETLGGGELARETVISEVCHEWGEGFEAGRLDLDKAIISCRGTEYKYIRNNQRGSEEFFNLLEDPGELRPDENVPESVKDRLKDRVDDHLESLYPPDSLESDHHLDESMEQHLRNLGYVE